ncbi:hypothetical protein K9M48_00825 [Candidatus Gracilibacteria bacterium]|nr:hypothetical protein [Candidatus Gracilibacteria bacterium]
MLNRPSESPEKLSDKEKLKDVQNFVKDMNEIGFEQGDRSINQGNTKLKIESVRGDGGSFVKLNLIKNGKEVFVYDMHASMFHQENGEDRPVGVTMKIDGKTMSYSGDENNEHGIYNNYHLLEGAKKHQKEILSMIEIDNNKRKEAKLKKEIK